MENYKYVLRYDEHINIDSKIIYDCLEQAWRVTPSKQNFMPYNVHVLTPEAKKHKQILYNKALKQQAVGSGYEIKNYKDLQKYDLILKKDGKDPFFSNLKSAPYIFLFSQRIEDEPNQLQQSNLDYGLTYCQTGHDQESLQHTEDIARIEVGMFSANLASALLHHQIDVSFTQCFPCDITSWTEHEFYFLQHNVLLIMTAGCGKKYRQDIPQIKDIDPKPAFHKIVRTEI
jgi:hypothetical protein